MAMVKQHRDDIVSIGKSIGFNNDFLSDRPFDRKSPLIDLRPDFLDDDPLPAMFMCHDAGHFRCNLNVRELIVGFFSTEPALERFFRDRAPAQSQRDGHGQHDPSEYDGECRHHDFLRDSQLR